MTSPQERQSANSSGSESKLSTSVPPTTAKKRASRAGTRSVTSLSAAQLERKRANDREAQRAIRQRTKEHIETLERRIAQLSASGESNEQLVVSLKRNKELEEENAGLRASLEQAHFALGMAEGSASNWEDVPTIKIPTQTQHGPIVTQQQLQTGTPAQTPREASTYSVAQQIPGAQWRSPSQYHHSPSTPRSSGTSALPDVQQQAHNQQQQWPAATSRAQSSSESIATPRSGLSESMDYSYMMSGGPQPSQPQRANSQPSLYQSIPQGSQQQMRHPSDQVNVGAYGQMPQEQMMMMQQRHQRGHSAQPGPSHAATQQVRVTSASHEQPMFYAPFSRQQ